jgi:hypothetical protein
VTSSITERIPRAHMTHAAFNVDWDGYATDASGRRIPRIPAAQFVPVDLVTFTAEELDTLDGHGSECEGGCGRHTKTGHCWHCTQDLKRAKRESRALLDISAHESRKCVGSKR